MNDMLDNYKRNLDWSIVVSTITAAIIIGGAAYGLRRFGMTTAANIIK